MKMIWNSWLKCRITAKMFTIFGKNLRRDCYSVIPCQRVVRLWKFQFYYLANSFLFFWKICEFCVKILNVCGFCNYDKFCVKKPIRQFCPCFLQHRNFQSLGCAVVDLMGPAPLNKFPSFCIWANILLCGWKYGKMYAEQSEAKNNFLWHPPPCRNPGSANV